MELPVWLVRIFLPLKAAWDWLFDLGHVLKPCRFSLTMVVISSAFLLFVEQGKEVLRGLARLDGPADVLHLSFFFAAVLLWAVNSWYWARQMLTVRFPDTPADSPRIDTFRRWVPRLLGTAAFVAVALALFGAAAAFGVSNHRAALMLKILSATSAVMAVVFFLFVTFRRRLFRSAFKQEEMGCADSLFNLGPVTRFHLVASNVFAIFLFLLFTLAPHWAAPKLGAATILLVATASWIPFGSWLVYLGGHYRFPVISFLLVLAAVFSFWNDNHGLREAEGHYDANLASGREKRVADWFEARKERLLQDGKTYPVFVVAAAGGGIRAAYWTAAVLSALEDVEPDTNSPKNFSSHVFALSGVSGGSLGSAVFAASVAKRRATGFSGCPDGTHSSLRACADRILSTDFLSPTLATMLYADFAQRFWPRPVPGFDRGKTLEESWERAWAETMNDDRFAQPMSGLWQDDARLATPSLFLNGTSVESGNRIIASNVRVEEPIFVDSVDVQYELKRPLRLSTAAHLSARFTYLSPAGTLRDSARGLTLGHVVDGGYFENSGASTSAEVLGAIQAYLRDNSLPQRVLPVVILISNDPHRASPCTDLQGADLGKPRDFLNESLSPLIALLKTRDARGKYAEATIRQQVDKREVRGLAFCLVLREHEIPLPLGWMLGESARAEINTQLNAMIRGVALIQGQPEDKSFVEIRALLD